MLEEARAAVAKEAMVSLFNVAYQNPTVRGVLAEIANDETKKAKGNLPEEKDLGSNRAVMLTTATAAVKAAKQIVQARGPFRPSKTIVQGDQDQNYRHYYLTPDVPNNFQRLGADAENDVITARYRELFHSGQIGETYEEESLLNRYSGPELHKEVFRIKDRWIHAREYPPKFQIDAERLYCVDEITKAMVLVVLNCEEFRGSLCRL